MDSKINDYRASYSKDLFYQEAHYLEDHHSIPDFPMKLKAHFFLLHDIHLLHFQDFKGCIH